MNLNKFTEKAQEALLESQNLAQSLGHQSIEPEHLLLSLIRQADGIVPQVLHKLNQSPDQLAALIERDLNARPRISGSNVQVSLSRAASDVLESAEREAKSMRDEYVSTEHMLLALAKSHTPIGNLLSARGLNANAILQALIAVRGSAFTRADLPAWLLLAVVTFWIAGFDLIYACQDVEVDRRERLHSIPADFGVATSLVLARACHALTVALLGGVGLVMGLGWPFWAGLGIIAGMLIYEHSLVSPHDLSRLDMAFFNMNGYISITALAATLAALWVRGV